MRRKPRGNRLWFELALGPSKRGFELLGVNCIRLHDTARKYHRETGHTGRVHPGCSVLATKSSSRYEISRKYHVNEDRPLVLKQNLSPSRSIVEGNGGGMRSFGRMI